MMSLNDRAAHIRAEAERFATALADLAPDARVPTCPEWSALELLQHLVQVHEFWAAVLGQGLDLEGVKRFDSERPALPDDVPTLLAARAAATEALLATLASKQPGDAAWSWFEPDQTVGFTWRMQTHEVTMHRVDAELAAGLPPGPIAPEFAADGIDHVIDVMWQWAGVQPDRRATGVIELRASDTGQSWLFETARWSGESWGQQFVDQPSCARAPAGARPDASVTGPAAALDLLVWNRADAGLTRAGDPSVLAEFQAVLDVGIL
ncbi:maleylpyruvate isomerase family mycothiol-dependent enzyme [Micrococcales bacterium 31B]|nr:maleylpyruvate isomerase family mycothiol-dependent enzyme [Micrococcales bacterium 31B]